MFGWPWKKKPQEEKTKTINWGWSRKPLEERTVTTGQIQKQITKERRVRTMADFIKNGTSEEWGLRCLDLTNDFRRK